MPPFSLHIAAISGYHSKGAWRAGAPAATARGLAGMVAAANGHIAGRALVRTRRGPIECIVSGEGPPVLMLHGTPGGSDQSLALARILALRDHRVVMPSRPGYLGTPLSVGQTPEEQADACAALLDALGIAQAAVVALSAGGVFAAELALRHPERVSRLVLLEAITARLDIAADDLLAAVLLLPRAVRNAPAVVALAVRRRRVRPIGAALALARSTLPFGARFGGVLNDTRQIDALADLPLGAIRAPTLLIHGTADQSVPYDQSVAAAAAIPGARLLTIQGGTHSSALFDRAALTGARDFLRRD